MPAPAPRRQTKARIAIAAVLSKASAPLTAADILAKATKAGTAVDRVTVYRELAALVEAGAVHAVQLKGRALAFEAAQHGHHHHLVCEGCGRVEEIDIDHDLEALERKIAKKTGFTDVRHALEFYGLCPKCS